MAAPATPIVPSLRDPMATEAPAGASAAVPRARRGRMLRAEIAARLAAPLEGGVTPTAVAGILQQVARQITARGDAIV